MDKDSKVNLKSSLGLFDATAISVGAIIGGGVFVVTGIAAGYTGSALAVSMLAAATISLLTALSFAELTAWQPKEGSVYEYAYQLISPFAGFLTGWMWVLSNTFAGAAVSLGFAYYFTALYPALPANLVAASLCIAFTVLNCFGIRQSAFLNNFLVTAKLLILVFFVIFGLAHANTANFAPFNPFDTGVLYGAFFIFFAYGGFARVAVVSEEVKDARRTVPRAIILSLAISTIIYILVGVTAVGLIGAEQLSSSDSPLTKAISITGNPAAVYLISAGGMLATASVLLTSILGVSRMTYAMAKRRDLPHILSRLHHKHGTPYYSILMIGAIAALLVLFVNLSKVVTISIFAMLFYYTLANVSALRLERKERIYPRFIPFLGAITCLSLLVLAFFISPQAWLIGLIGLTAGILFYVAKNKIPSKHKTSM
jgi:APA family basic amino acid/polyamine antiporter